MEKYGINLCNGWSIENLQNVNKDIKFDKVDFELPFAEHEFYEGKISWIYDYMKPTDETINELKEIEPFAQTASFKVFLLKGEWKEIDSFEGTFIDALRYIQKEFNNDEQ